VHLDAAPDTDSTRFSVSIHNTLQCVFMQRPEMDCVPQVSVRGLAVQNPWLQCFVDTHNSTIIKL
jgi:hypothetical protein